METLEHWVGLEYLRIFLAKEFDKIKLLTAIVHVNFKHGIKDCLYRIPMPKKLCVKPRLFTMYTEI